MTTKKMRDPINDPDGFADDLEARLSARDRTQRVQERADRLWQKFQDTHKDLANAAEIVHPVAKRIAAERVQGGEAIEDVLTDSGFMDEVAEAARERLAELTGGGKRRDDDDPAPRQRQRKRDQGGRFSITDEAGESVDITADDLGMDEGSKAMRERTGQPTGVDELNAMRRKAGFI